MRTAVSVDETAGDASDPFPDPVVVVDRSGTILRANAAAQCWFPDLPGGPVASLFCESCVEAVLRFVASGWLGVDEGPLVLRDGRPVIAAATGVRDGYLVAIRDVSCARQVYAVRTRQQLIGALSDVSGAIARELTDPVAIVLGRLELLNSLGVESEATRKHLDVALDHARRIAASMHNLRMVGRGAELVLGRAFIADAFADATGLLGSRVRAVRLDPVIAPEELAAGGDVAVIARVLALVLGLAIDVTARGARIDLRAWREGAGVRVVVAGGSAAGSTAVRGDPVSAATLGIGVAATLLESSGGAFEARRVGSGLLFVLQLPDAPERPSKARPTGERIIVVGSAAFCAGIAQLTLGEFAVERMDSAEQVLTLPALDGAAIVSDLLLPGISGLTLAQAVRRRDPEAIVAVVADGWIEPRPPDVITLSRPLSATALLSALGLRARRRR